MESERARIGGLDAEAESEMGILRGGEETKRLKEIGQRKKIEGRSARTVMRRRRRKGRKLR